MAELNYTPDPNEPEQSFDPVPVDDYIAVIESSEYKDNKQGTGRILVLEYQIIEGHYKGRKIFENLNLENANEQTAIIARKSLNSICIATGITHLKDSSQLHNIPMKITVGIKKDEQYGDKNTIKKHLSLNNSSTSPAQPAQTGEAQKKDAPPWATKK